jgi:hypothetical protein
MTSFRLIPLALALTSAGALVACNTAPAMPMGATSATSMAKSDDMARMDAQMKIMQGMHEKMMAARTPEERNKLMAEHMSTMQDSMKMMDGMGGAGMGDMKSMQGMLGMSGEMGTRHQMMEKRMEMMQGMMKMMMDRLPVAPVK